MHLPVFAAVLLLTRAASADDGHLALTPLQPLDAAPDLTIGSEATCSDPRVITTRKLAVGAALLAIVHDCGQSEEATRLSIRGETGGWFESPSITYEYQGAHMTDAPGFFHLLDESLSTGTLADGRVAIVHRVTRQEGTRCWKESACPRGAETSHVASFVEVCTLDTPACGQVELACPASGCTPVVLRGGILTMQTDRGRNHVRVE